MELSRFVEHDDINMLYLDTPYYVYPENEQAEEAFHVIAAALAKTERVGIGRIVVSQRERPVALQPFESGMLLSMLRTAEEVRRAEFDEPSHKLDPQMVDIATTIIDRLTGKFEPKGFHDQYQDALRELVESKQKGKPLQRAKIEEPSNVVDLMAVLKKSLASTGAPKAGKAAANDAESDTRRSRPRKPAPRKAMRASARCCCRSKAARKPRPNAPPKKPVAKPKRKHA